MQRFVRFLRSLSSFANFAAKFFLIYEIIEILLFVYFPPSPSFSPLLARSFSLFFFSNKKYIRVEQNRDFRSRFPPLGKINDIYIEI